MLSESLNITNSEQSLSDSHNDSKNSVDENVLIDTKVDDDDRCRVMTAISNDKTCKIIQNKGNFSLVNLGHRMQQMTQMTFQKILNYFSIKNLWKIQKP
jgi:hypothetical protein